MLMRRQFLSSFVLSLMLTLGLWSKPGYTAGPWKAQVVDAETGKPLEGVVVLAYWIKYTESWAGTAGGEFYDAEEVVTAPDGLFVVQARSTWTLNPFRRIGGMELVIFKPGYGQWRFQGYMDWPKDIYEQTARVKKAWEQFEGDGVVIELPPLKTRKERLEFLGRVGPPALVPRAQTKHLEEAIDQERVYLGFRRMYGGKP